MAKDFKYLAFYNQIKDQVAKGEYQEGDMLPSESQFMAKFGISRITVRNALALLEQDGYVYKIQGKGCYVAGNFRQQSLDKIHSYTDMILDAGMVPGRKILSCVVETSTDREAALLHLKKNDPVFHLKRIITADGLPICLTKATLPYPLIIGIEQTDFNTTSLYDVLEKAYGYVVDRTTMTFEASAADGFVSELLSISAGTPLLIYNSTSYTKVGKDELPIELCESYYLTSKIKYRLDKRR
jgi:DNA-binding GntR family transcriptional regulator